MDLQLGTLWLAGSMAAAVVLGWAFVRLFMSHAVTMTYVTIYSNIVLPAAAAVSLMVLDQVRSRGCKVRERVAGWLAGWLWPAGWLAVAS